MAKFVSIFANSEKFETQFSVFKRGHVKCVAACLRV